MKILQINVCLNVLSTGRIVEQIGEVAAANGYECYSLSFGELNDSKLNAIQINGNFERNIHRIANRFFDMQGLWSRKATAKAIQKIEQINPDIIHLHNIHDCWLNFSLLFEYIIKHNKPVVWTFHDCWAFTGHCAYFDDINCEKWHSLCHNCGLIKVPSLDRSKQNFALKKTLFTSVPNMTLIPVSEWLNRLTKESFLGKYPIQTIHNGIDIEAFRPMSTDLRERLELKDKFIVLGVASPSAWGPSKGLNDFVTLSKYDKYKIVLIGIPETLSKQLPPEILCIKKTDNQKQLAEYYSMADIFVNPTYHDNYPTVNLEALACGTPVITYRTGGSPEALTDSEGIIINEKLGAIVEKGNIDRLVAEIDKIQKETHAEQHFRRLICRQHAEKTFDKNMCYNSYVELYNRILSYL